MADRTITIPRTELTPEQIAGGFLVFDGITGIAVNFTTFNIIMGTVRTGIGAWLVLTKSPEQKRRQERPLQLVTSKVTPR